MILQALEYENGKAFLCLYLLLNFVYLHALFFSANCLKYYFILPMNLNDQELEIDMVRNYRIYGIMQKDFICL